LYASSAELPIAWTMSFPASSSFGKKCALSGISPFWLSQVARNNFWYSATTGPSICTWVSRQADLFGSLADSPLPARLERWMEAEPEE